MHAGLKTKRKILSSWINQVFGGVAEAADPLTTSTFYAPLTHSLVLTRGTGNPTYTRATTAYVTDFEGLLKQVPSGASRFSGARVVRNLVSGNSDTLSGFVALTAGTGTVTKTAGQSDPFGGTSAIRLQCTKGTGLGVLQPSPADIPVPTGSNAQQRVWIKSNTGVSQQVAFYDNNKTSAAYITATTEWTIASFKTTGTVSGGVNWIIGATGTVTDCDVLLYGIQSENVTGQTNQNPSEYVSVGVLSAPYHGAGVDGCKYFATENDNTVASNVVTEATGATIAAATLLGYQAEGARTNLCLQSQALDNAGSWTIPSFTVSANAIAAPDGTTTADSLLEVAVSALHYANDATATVVSGSTYTYSCYFKILGRQWVYINAYDGSSHYSWFDLTNGVVGTNAAGNTSTITALPNGWYRCTVTRAVGSTSAILQIGTTTADNNSANFMGDITKGVYAWGAQLEAAAFASTYIPTTTVAVARNAEIDSYGATSNIAAAASTVLLSFTPTHAPSGTIALWGTYVDASNYTALLHDGTNLIFRKRIAGANTDATKALPFAAGTTYKIAFSWGAAGQLLYVDGVAGTPHADTASAQVGSTIQIGADGNSLQQPFASIKADYHWTSQLTAAQHATVST